MTLTIRRTEPEDYPAVQRIVAGPRVVWGTLQLLFPAAELWRKRLADTPDTKYGLVACIDDEVVGQLDIHMLTNPRRRHVGQLGMAVRDDMQGRGVGAALMQAAVDVADNWLNSCAWNWKSLGTTILRCGSTAALVLSSKAPWCAMHTATGNTSMSTRWPA